MLLAFLLAATLAVDEVPPVRGRLCIADRDVALNEGKCSDVEGVTLKVEPADKERLFLWTNADAKTAQLGVIPAKASKIELESERAELTMAIVAGASPNWPADTTITLKGTDEWRWTLPAKVVTHLERVFVPAGTYSLRVEAEHHRSAFRARIAVTADGQRLGELRLVPLRVVRGTVVDAEGKAIPSAVIAFEDGPECTIANEQGMFACEMLERPSAPRVVLVVSAPGYTTREVNLYPDLQRITLTKGRPLIVKIVRPDAAKKARATLYLDSSERLEHSKIATRDVTEREQELTFDGAGKGRYIVVVEGSGPLEKLSVPVVVNADEDARATITIEPFQLEGTLRFGDEPVTGGTIKVSTRDRTWHETLPIHAGAFGGTMWQHGSVMGYLTLPGGEMGEFVHSPELGDHPSHWDVKIEKRMIAGRVFDAVTKLPVQADIEVVAEFESGEAHFGTKVSENGAYEILASRPGTYTLEVTSPEHAARLIEVKIAPENQSRTLDIALDAGVAQPLAIVTPTGQPLAHAQILEGVKEDGVNPRFQFRADADGTFLLRGAPGETRVLYVLPRGGSFAIVRVVLPKMGEAPPMQVVVAPPAGALRVKTTPHPAALLIRYNGQFLSGAIARFINGQIPGTGPTGEVVLSRFPAGTYEVWALAGPKDEAALMASNGTSRRPERVGLSAGETAVTVVAPEREPSPQRGSPQ